ncbi:MAG: hypothetical protein KDA28_03110 [Phycisphaerales bacterium]|nr:hypothetical protein [Phycisphaerales bacterium]
MLALLVAFLHFGLLRPAGSAIPGMPSGSRHTITFTRGIEFEGRLVSVTLRFEGNGRRSALFCPADVTLLDRLRLIRAAMSTLPASRAIGVPALFLPEWRVMLTLVDLGIIGLAVLRMARTISDWRDVIDTWFEEQAARRRRAYAVGGTRHQRKWLWEVSHGRCPSCSYHVQDLLRCPECGEDCGEEIRALARAVMHHQVTLLP